MAGGGKHHTVSHQNTNKAKAVIFHYLYCYLETQPVFWGLFVFLKGEHFSCRSGEQQPPLTSAAHLGWCHLSKILLKYTHV